jgi:uncharacterized membrane protein
MIENDPVEGLSTLPDKSKMLIMLGWGCLLAGWLLPIAGLIGVVVAYISRKDHPDASSQSHFEAIIKTFWLGLIGAIISGILIITFIGAIIGYPLAIIVSVWVSYRAIKGLIRANDRVGFV